MITPEKLAASGTEDGHQSALFCWAATPEIKARYPMLAYMHAIPNGGARSAATAARMAATGVKSGIPDIFLPYPTPRLSRVVLWHGLYIELKRPASVGKRAGAVSDKQDETLNWLRKRDYVVAVCFGWLDAKAVIEAYLLNDA